MKTQHFIFLLLLMFTEYAFAQKTASKSFSVEIDKILSEQFKVNETGCTALIAQKGQIIYKKAFGMANLELNVPMQADMVFRIGSISKQFTAIAILQLMEQGKLSLQDDITKFIPDYPTHGYQISIEHLLTHTSGIKSYTNMKKFEDNIRKDMKPEEVIDFFKHQPMEFAPGTKWNYNNSGYFLLGYIIGKLSGKSYPEYVEEVFFKPLGMTNSFYGSDTKIIKNRASGYQAGKNGVENASIMSMTQPYAAGSLQSTVEDLFKWHQAVHTYKLVKKETLEKAFTKYKLTNGKTTNYGYGWFLEKIQGSPTIEHGGGINGFLTQAIYLPQEDVFVAVFSNSNAKSPDNHAMKIVALAIGKPFDFKEIILEESAQIDYIGVYENEEGEQRIITWEDKKLYSQRTGGTKYQIKPYQKDKYFFETSFTMLDFLKNADNKVYQVISRYKGTEVTWIKTDKPIPTRIETKVSESILAKYVGDYQFAPNFVLSITKEGNKLFAQATGQSKNEIFAESESKFFLKVIDAQVEFFKDDSGNITKLMLHQDGQKTEGKKIK